MSEKSSTKPAPRSAREYVESGDHLPVILRDFHDAKRLFKTLHGMVNWKARRREGEAKAPGEISWLDANVYVVDIFLWLMAKRGWTLQRSRARVEFIDLAAEMKDRDAAAAAILRGALKRGGGNA